MTQADLHAALGRLFPGASEPRRLSGGASQETWAFSSANRELILRRRPDGALRSDDGRTVSLPTEAAVITAVAAAGAPVPEIVHICAVADDLGEAYVMARVEGETLGRRIVRDPAFATVRPTLAAECGKVLAAIHRTTPPVPLATSDAAAELDRYEAIYRASGARRPVLELTFAWLRRRLLPPVPPVLVHGDFRNGNLMIHPERGLTAVLDWELCHLGDPAEDLGWLCVNSWRFGGEAPVGGFGAYQDLLDAYAHAGGRPVTLRTLLYWQMLGSLKWGVMCLIMYASYASGADPSVERAMIGRRVSETEIDLVNLLERAE